MSRPQKNWHQSHRESRSLPTRLADAVAEFVGSWTCIVLHIVWFGVWILFRIEEFPYGLLTMIVSLEAILLSTFIMISENRQGDRDREQAKADYETNLAAKNEIEELQRELSRPETEKLDEILRLLKTK